MTAKRRRSPLSRFFLLFGIIAFGVLIAKHAVIPLLVWIQMLIGGNV